MVEYMYHDDLAGRSRLAPPSPPPLILLQIPLPKPKLNRIIPHITPHQRKRLENGQDANINSDHAHLVEGVKELYGTDCDGCEEPEDP